MRMMDSTYSLIEQVTNDDLIMRDAIAAMASDGLDITLLLLGF